MRTRTTTSTTILFAAGLSALALALACGGSQPAADTPTNEGTVPSDSNSTQAPSGTDLGAGGLPGVGGGAAIPGNDATTPPDGYAGSPGPGSTNKPERHPKDSNPTVAPEPS